MNTLINPHFLETEQQLGLPQEAVSALEAAAGKLDVCPRAREKFDILLSEHLFPQAHDFKTCFGNLKKLSMGCGIKAYTLNFVFLIAAAEIMHARYRERGLSDKLFWDTLMDLKYKHRECVDCKGIHGIFVPGWYQGFYALRRFALGRYQYDMNTFDREDFTSAAGITVKTGDKVLGIHIPSSFVPLTDEVRMDSLKRAYAFFPEFRRPDGLMIFECSSWLLDPNYKTFLPSTANTVRFIDDFEITACTPCEKFTDAWRIFDRWGYLSPRSWPEDNSLRRAFKHHVLAGGKTSHGHGIIVFDGEKIVR